MDLFFYIPKNLWPDPLPDRHNAAWEGYGRGIYCWTLQTYYKLSNAGYNCHLTSEIPHRGIIVAHRGCLADALVPTREQYFVCMQADWSRHPFAQAHICQNRRQTTRRGIPRIDRAFLPGRTYFVNLWPQPGLVRRSPTRETALRSISYFGLPLNIAPELAGDQWRSFLDERGIEWRVVDAASGWSDYSETDAALFIRDFTGAEHISKPATKLYNAWLANVLPICAPESAYLDEMRCVGGEAALVRSFDELKAQVREIQEHPSILRNILDHNSALTGYYSEDRMVAQWVDTLEQIRRACCRPSNHRVFMLARRAGAGIARAVRSSP